MEGCVMLLRARLQEKEVKALAVLLAFTVALPMSALSQTYKCKTPSGGTTFSDIPCQGGTRQERVIPGGQSEPQYQVPQNGNARLLDAKVAEAIGTGDIGKAKGLAVTTEHWRMIAEAEQRPRQGVVTGRTDADLRAEAKNSQECKSAQRSYDVEASSIQRNGAAINAAKHAMYSACGMTEPTVIDNRTVINDNRRISAPPPAPRQMNCRQTGGGYMECL